MVPPPHRRLTQYSHFTDLWERLLQIFLRLKHATHIQSSE